MAVQNIDFFPLHATTNGDLIDGDIDTAPTAASGFSKNNLLDRSRYTRWKANAAASTHTFDFDVNITEHSGRNTIDYVILCGTDAKSVIGSPLLNVWYSALANFSSPTQIVTNQAINSEPHFLKEFSSTGGDDVRYWRVQIADAATSGTPVLGSIYFGLKLSASTFYDTGDTIGQSYDNTLKTFGGRTSSKLNRKPKNIWNIQWRFMSETFRTNLQTVHLRCQGSHYPLFIKDDKGTLRFVRIYPSDGNFTPNRSFHQIYEYGLTIIEEDVIDSSDGDGIAVR